MEHILQSGDVMESRRFKDIVAFKREQSAPMAFHARNLEVAEISEELWNLLKSPESNQEAYADLLDWESSEAAKNSALSNGFGEVRSLTINVTQICNLKCTYCAAGGDGTYGFAQTKIDVEKTLPQLKFFMEKLPENSRFHITFLGGEPLLYPEGIRAIGAYVSEVGKERNLRAEFSIVTNGTLLSEKNLELLSEIKANVTISVDGPSAINDRLRPSKNGHSSTEMIIEGLARLQKHRKDLGIVRVHGVFGKDNTEILKAYEFYESLDVDQYEFSFSVESSDEVTNKKFISEMNAIAALAYVRGGEAGIRKISFFDQQYSILDRQVQIKNHCPAGKNFLMVDAKNNLYTCPWDVGNVSAKVGQGTDLDVVKLDEYRENLVEKNNCQECWARFMCGGGCMFIHQQATGSKHKKDANFCARTRELISTAIFYYKLSREFC